MDHWPPDVTEKPHITSSDISNCLARDQELLNNIPTTTGRRKPFVVKDSRSRNGSSGQKARKSRAKFGQGDLLQIKKTRLKHPTSILVILLRIPRDHVNPDRGVKNYTQIPNLDTIANTVKFFIGTSPPVRV